MHPYAMQSLLKQRGKDEVVNVRQRGSLYKVIDRLRMAELITVRETTREQQRPERTVYELADAGREMSRVWMREALSTPKKEFPEFAAAMAFLPLLTPDDVLTQLEKRQAALRTELVRITAELAVEGGQVARLFLLEMEYLRSLTAAEMEWVASVIDDLRDGRITWTQEWLDEMSPVQDAANQSDPA